MTRETPFTQATVDALLDEADAVLIIGAAVDEPRTHHVDAAYLEAMHDAAYPYRAIGRTVLYLPTGRPVRFGGFDTRERARRVAATLNRVRQ